MSKNIVALTTPDQHTQTSSPDEVAMRMRGLARILAAASVTTGRGGQMSPEDVFNHEATYWLAEAVRDLAQDLDGMSAAEATASYEALETS